MEYEQNKNHFRWPAVDDITDYRWENVIGSIEAPEITGVRTKKEHKNVYAVTDEDWCVMHVILYDF